MKYNIFIPQDILVSISGTKLDIKDAAILSYLADFCIADDKGVDQANWVENGVSYRYTWIDYSHLTKEMPLLKFNQTSSIVQRIKKLQSVGFIKTMTVNSEITGQRKVYVRLTEKIKQLFFKPTNVNLLTNKSALSRPTNVDLLNIPIIEHTNNRTYIAPPEQNFNFPTYLLSLKQHKNRLNQIIYLYWVAKNFKFENKKQAGAALTRDLRAAKNLEGYTDDKINQTLDYLRKNMDFKWTLETVHKFIDEISTLRSGGKTIDLSEMEKLGMKLPQYLEHIGIKNG